MDVRCDRCKTEYEFDDSRVTENGVAVKCTTCGHVFKVKKKAVVFTVPVKPEEAESDRFAPLNTGPSPSPGPSDKKEWKVRQVSGSIISFRELTTLQKWIVERKLTRDDEISLTGESWKRLGDIPELQSFFQVVDEANLARLMSLPTEGKQKAARAPQPSFEISQHSSDAAVTAPNWSPVEEMRTRVRSDRGVRSASLDDLAISRGPEVKWLLALAAVAVLVLAYFIWPRTPQQPIVRVPPQEEKRAFAKPPVTEPAVVPAAAIDAGIAEEVQDAGTSAVAQTAIAQAAVDGGTPGNKAKGGTFDSFLAKGDRLRDSDKPEAALEAYQRAIDLKPTRAEPFAGRGLAYMDLGQAGMAEAEFKQALRLNPRYGPAIMGLAETYRALGRKDDAIEYYQLYLEELPRGPEAAIAQTQIQRLQE